MAGVLEIATERMDPWKDVFHGAVIELEYDGEYFYECPGSRDGRAGDAHAGDVRVESDGAGGNFRVTLEDSYMCLCEDPAVLDAVLGFYLAHLGEDRRQASDMAIAEALGWFYASVDGLYGHGLNLALNALAARGVPGAKLSSDERDQVLGYVDCVGYHGGVSIDRDAVRNLSDPALNRLEEICAIAFRELRVLTDRMRDEVEGLKEPNPKMIL